jgi:hypothetical protein
LAGCTFSSKHSGEIASGDKRSTSPRGIMEP